jgi:hypothetical protein
VFWLREFRGLTWLKLALRAVIACVLALLLGLLLDGRDGRMSTYLAMVLACSATLWWSLWRVR